MEEKELKKTSGFEIAAITIVLLLPVMNMYKAMSHFSFADIAVGMLFIALILKKRGHLELNSQMRPLVFLAMWIVVDWVIGSSLVSLVYSVHLNAVANSFFSACRVAFYYVFAAAFSVQITNWKLMFRVYRFFVVLFSVVTIVQFVIHALTGRVLLGYFMFLPIMNSNVDADALIVINTRSMYRPSSVFTEPGMYARYVVPYICIYLFDENKVFSDSYKTKTGQTIEFAVVMLAVLICRAGQIFPVLLIILLFWIINLIKLRKISRKFAAVVMLFVLGALFYTTTDSFQYMLIRISPALSDTKSNSFGTRIYKGFLVYAQLPFWTKIFGVGYGNAPRVTEVLNIVTQYDTVNTINYMNGIALMLVNTGIVGGIALVYTFIKPMLTNKNYYVKTMCAVFLALSFAGGTPVGMMGVMYFVYLFGLGFDREFNRIGEMRNE